MLALRIAYSQDDITRLYHVCMAKNTKQGKLAELLSSAMTKRNMSVQALAAAIGVQRQTCYAWLHEQQRPTLEMLHRISLVLDISFGTLASAVYGDTRAAALELLVELYLGLPEQDQDEALWFLRALDSKRRQIEAAKEKPDSPAML